MGIKDYHKWMVANHPSAFKKKWLDFYDHVYIDINFALHHSHYGTTSQSQILFKFFSFIEKMVLLFHPTKSITIANDGPAPIAKLLLQRERRASASREIKNLETSSLIFTPGTEFMNTIQEKLEKFMKKIKVVYNIDVDYMIGCEGEAELKLKKKMMDRYENNSKDTHIIISNDADIVAMFGTFDINAYSKIFICCDVKNTEILSMGALMETHTEKYGMSKSFGLDFTLISILLGNDYLPKISFGDLTKLWNSYQKWVSKYKDGLVNIGARNRMVGDLPIPNHPICDPENKDFSLNIPFFTQILNGILSRTQVRFIYQFTIDSYNTPLYSNYMEGVLWCLDMYNKGLCDRYNYMYQCDDPPHPFGLILSLYENPESAKFKNIVYPSLNPDLYALLVFPKKALALANAKYHDFAKKYNILYEEETCGICNDFYDELSKLNFSEKKYKEIYKEMKIHKNNHNIITADNVEEIANDFKEQLMLKI
jgi:5'-3' exonuclease